MTSGANLKREGQQLALELEGDWRDRIVLEFTGWAAMERRRGLSTFTIERFRHDARNQPASHKAWGALPRILVAERLAAPENDREGNAVYRPAVSPKTHAHPVRVWRFL